MTWLKTVGKNKLHFERLILPLKYWVIVGSLYIELRKKKKKKIYPWMFSDLS